MPVIQRKEKYDNFWLCVSVTLISVVFFVYISVLAAEVYAFCSQFSVVRLFVTWLFQAIKPA